MHKLLALSLILSLSLATVAAAERVATPADNTPPAASQTATPNDQSQQQVLGYAIGFNVGGNLREGGVEVDLMSLQAGVSDGLRGVPPKYTEAELNAAFQRLQEMMQQRAMAEVQRMGEENKRKGEAFLAQNRKQPGVQQTPSGLQYKVVKQGDGPSPTVNDTVRCHYRGTLMDGTEFETSYGDDPVEFPVQGVIPGWTEALQKMHVGDKWQLFIPADLAYGMASPDPSIAPGSLLIFDIELLDIVQK